MDSEKVSSLVYVSSAVRLFSTEELRELLAKSRSKNARFGLTGMLLYKDGNFIQAVEGPPESLATMERTITADPRHKDFTALLRSNEVDRNFPDWTMGFRDLSEIDLHKVEGFSTLLQSRSLPEAFRFEPSKAHKLLLTFKGL